MAKYLSHGSYTLEGVRGLLKEGGSRGDRISRRLSETLGAKWRHSTTLSEETTSTPS